MAAITWRNVEGSSGGAEASAILQAANQNFNAGLGTLDKLLKQREAVDASNWENTKVNNNNAIQARLASARTPEELAAMEGEIAQMGAGMGAQVDANLLANGVREQMGKLRTQTTQDRAYEDSEFAYQFKDSLTDVDNDIAAGNWVSAEQKLNSFDAKGLETDRIARIRAGRQESKKQANADEDRAASVELRNHQITAAKRAAEEADAAEDNKAVDAQTRIEIDEAARPHKLEQEQLGYALGALAKEFGYPTDIFGKLDKSALSSEQLQQVEDAAKTRLGIKSPEKYGVGDSAAFQKQLNAMSTRMSPDVLERNTAYLEKAFSTGGTAAIGNEARLAALGEAMNATAADELATNKFFKPGSGEGTKAYDELQTKLPSMVRNQANMESVSEKMYKIAANGVKLKSGDVVVPSIALMQAAITATSDDYGPTIFGVGSHGMNVEKWLKRYLNTTAGKDAMKAGEEITQINRNQNLGNNLREQMREAR